MPSAGGVGGPGMLRSTARLALRLLRDSRPMGRLEAALPTTALAVATALLLLTLGASVAFGVRAQRTAWRSPEVAAGRPTAVYASATDTVRGRPILVVDVAALSPSAPPPPGLHAFPRPGEVYVSPALAQLIGRLPGRELGDRFPSRPAGILGRRALAAPDELVAVIGREATEPAMTRTRHVDLRDRDIVPATVIDAMSRTPDARAAEYQDLALMGSVLMVVPLLALGGAASRLLAARRNQRLSLLRLVGASAPQVTRLALTEAAALGLAGALLGAVGYAAVLPLAARVGVGGGRWFVGDLWIGLPLLLAAIAGVVALAMVSALGGIRSVVTEPLAVARRQRPRTIRVWRAGLLLAAFAVLWTRSDSGVRAASVPLAAVAAAVALSGPLVVRVVGRGLATMARRPAGLLAGRRLLDDPGSGWRAVSGLVLAGFVAGFLVVVVQVAAEPDTSSADPLAVSVPAEEASRTRDAAASRLVEAGVPAEVTIGDGSVFAPRGYRQVEVTVNGDLAAGDRVRTLLWGLAPGQMARTESEADRPSDLQARDVQIAAVLVLVVSFLVAAVSSGVGGIARVLDQRTTLTLQRLAGTPLEQIAAARRIEVMAPLVVLGGGAAVMGLVCGVIVVGGYPTSGRPIALFGGTALVGVASVLIADLLSRPVLRSVTADLDGRE